MFGTRAIDNADPLWQECQRRRWPANMRSMGMGIGLTDGNISTGGGGSTPANGITLDNGTTFITLDDLSTFVVQG